MIQINNPRNGYYELLQFKKKKNRIEFIFIFILLLSILNIIFRESIGMTVVSLLIYAKVNNYLYENEKDLLIRFIRENEYTDLTRQLALRPNKFKDLDFDSIKGFKFFILENQFVLSINGMENDKSKVWIEPKNIAEYVNIRG